MWLQFVCKQSDKDPLSMFMSVFGSEISAFFPACYDYILTPPEIWLMKLCVLNTHSSMHIFNTISKKNSCQHFLFSTEVHKHLLAQSHVPTET